MIDIDDLTELHVIQRGHRSQIDLHGKINTFLDYTTKRKKNRISILKSTSLKSLYSSQLTFDWFKHSKRLTNVRDVFRYSYRQRALHWADINELYRRYSLEIRDGRRRRMIPMKIIMFIELYALVYWTVLFHHYKLTREMNDSTRWLLPTMQ